MRVLLILAVVTAAGCNRGGDPAAAEEAVALTPETPLLLKINAKGQTEIYGKWLDLFLDANKITKYLRGKAQRYRETYAYYQIPLARAPIGAREVEVLPTEVILEVQRGANASWIAYLERTCQDFGFVRFTVKPPDGELPEAEAPPPEPAP
jgi:hypothetical protein